MPRGGSRTSETFESSLQLAARRLWDDWEEARSFQHNATVGSNREDAVIRFLDRRLPTRYGFTKGEAVDHRDRHSSQLDVIVYDESNNSPLVGASTQGTQILPVEALLAVVEVKSTLSRDEIAKCVGAARQLKEMKPYGDEFERERTRGASADLPRVLYSVFAFDTDLRANNWPGNEWRRLLDASDGDASDIDRIVVLNRGLVQPPNRVAKVAEPDSVLLEWFLHLYNFLRREVRRRRPVDWQNYVARFSSGWFRLADPSYR